MNTKVLRIRQVIDKTGLGRSQIFALVRDGQFPRQIKLGARAAGWIEAEVETWIASRIAVRAKTVA